MDDEVSGQEAEGEVSAYQPPLSTSLPRLIEAGGDSRFRQMLADLDALNRQLSDIRLILSSRIGLRSPQYSILMAVAHYQGVDGISIGDVADHLHVTGPFITTEAAALSRFGLLEKRQNPRDGRGVLLRLTARGTEAVENLTSELVAINDATFGILSRRGFLQLSAAAAKLVESSKTVLEALKTS